MTAAEVLPLEPRSGDDLAKIRSRLFEAAADLKLRPVPSPHELVERLQATARELEEIRVALRLVIHLAQLDEAGFDDQLAEVTQRLHDGWVPEADPVSEVVDELRRRSAH